MPTEVYNQVNSLQFDQIGTVTTALQKIPSIYSFTNDANDQSPKTVVLTNDSSVSIYFSSRISASSSDAGGVLQAHQQREFPMADLRNSPYFFVASGNANMRIEVWR